MSKLTCPCGFTFSFVACPGPGMCVVRDTDKEKYIECIVRMNKIQFEKHNGMLPPKGTEENDEFHENLYKSMDLEGMLLECPECGRLIWRKPGSEEFSSYIKG